MTVQPDKLNQIVCIPAAIQDTSENLLLHDPQVPAGAFVYEEDTQVFRVGTGLPFSKTLNHSHKDQYSPLGHSHYFGYGEKWFRQTPRLWLSSDLVNHPELVPLRGQVVTGDIASGLCDIYSGLAQLSPVLTSAESNLVSISASSTYSALYEPWHLFGPSLTTENYFRQVDQWLPTIEDAEPTLVIQFLGEVTYRIDHYHLFARIGGPDNPFISGPSPKAWTVQGSLDGVSWILLDTVADEPAWDVGTGREFTLDTQTVDIKYLKFTFTEWNTGENTDIGPGLKRLVLFGKQTNVFNMPNVPSPHEEFTWVVPYTDLGIGMKHEEVGDVGYTAAPIALMPANRLPLDGRTVLKASEPDLFAVLGYTYDPENTLSGITLEADIGHTVSVVDNSIVWTSEVTDNLAVAEYFDILGMTERISSYYLAPINNDLKPTQWSIEAYDGTAWTVLHDMTVNPDTEVYGWYTIPTDHESLNVQTYRVIVNGWSGTGTLGLAPMRLKTHPANKFYIPDWSPSTTTSTIPYIVSKVRVEDVNDNIVASLQNDIATALNLLISAQSRIAALEIQLASQ